MALYRVKWRNRVILHMALIVCSFHQGFRLELINS
jgi:hypothetical protein